MLKSVPIENKSNNLILIKGTLTKPAYMTKSAYTKAFCLPKGDVLSERLKELRDMIECLSSYLELGQSQEFELSRSGIRLFIKKTRAHILVDSVSNPKLTVIRT